MSSAGEVRQERGCTGSLFETLNHVRGLSLYGPPPSDNDMYAIVLGSLPYSYDSYISVMSATSSVLDTTISADSLMTTITDKYDC